MEPEETPQPILIDLGCGKAKIEREGYRVIGVDLWEKSDADIIASAYALPLDDESVDAIYARHFFEHFSYEDLIKVFAECFRILKNKGELEIICPHYSAISAYQDPTHRTFFTQRTFYKFTPFGFRVTSTAFHWMRRPYRGRFPWLVRTIDRMLNKHPSLERYAALIGGIYEIKAVLEKAPEMIDTSHTEGAKILAE